MTLGAGWPLAARAGALIKALPFLERKLALGTGCSLAARAGAIDPFPQCDGKNKRGRKPRKAARPLLLFFEASRCQNPTLMSPWV